MSFKLTGMACLLRVRSTLSMSLTRVARRQLHRAPPQQGDRGFESLSLPRRVSREPDVLDPGADRALCDRPQELLFVGSDARWSPRRGHVLPLKNVVLIVCRPRVLRVGANREVCGSQRGGVWRMVRDRRLAGPYHSRRKRGRSRLHCLTDEQQFWAEFLPSLKLDDPE